MVLFIKSSGVGMADKSSCHRGHFKRHSGFESELGNSVKKKAIFGQLLWFGGFKRSS